MAMMMVMMMVLVGMMLLELVVVAGRGLRLATAGSTHRRPGLAGVASRGGTRLVRLLPLHEWTSCEFRSGSRSTAVLDTRG